MSEDPSHAAVDGLRTRQERREAGLGRQQLADGTLGLSDLTTVHVKGHTCPLAAQRASRRGRAGRAQIRVGLLYTPTGCPVAVEVFAGDAAEPGTISRQIGKLRQRFGLPQVVLVGDRGILTAAQLREDTRPTAGLDWITPLRAPAVRTLAATGAVRLPVLDGHGLLEASAAPPDTADRRPPWRSAVPVRSGSEDSPPRHSTYCGHLSRQHTHITRIGRTAATQCPPPARCHLSWSSPALDAGPALADHYSA